MYCWLYHFALLISNFVPDFPIRSTVNASISSSIVKSSCCVPGFQPRNARKFVVASCKYPCCLKPIHLSPLAGSFQSNGNIGNPPASASRLLNLPLPSGFNNNGKWANCGIVSSQPKKRYNNTCNGADGNHSSPRITCEISIKWSSTIFAKWYVGIPSDFNNTLSSIVEECTTTQ